MYKLDMFSKKIITWEDNGNNDKILEVCKTYFQKINNFKTRYN